MNNQLNSLKEPPAPSTLFLLSVIIFLSLLIYTTGYIIESAFNLSFHLTFFQSFAVSWSLIWGLLILCMIRNMLSK
jgi:hypothetical protein